MVRTGVVSSKFCRMRARPSVPRHIDLSAGLQKLTSVLKAIFQDPGGSGSTSLEDSLSSDMPAVPPVAGLAPNAMTDTTAKAIPKVSLLWILWNKLYMSMEPV